MRYRIEGRINDGKAEAPAVEVVVDSVDELLDSAVLFEAATNDNGEPFGVGSTITITRLT